MIRRSHLLPLMLAAVAAGALDSALGEAHAAEELSHPGAPPATLRMALLRAQQTAAGYDFAGDADGILRARAGRSGEAALVEATGRGVRLSRAGDGLSLGVATVSVGRERGPGSRRMVRRHAEGQELG